MYEVRLERYELEMAGQVGSRRQISAVLRGSEPRYPESTPGQLHDNHIRAAMSELAVAKYLNVHWGGHYDTYTKIPDVGGYEVRYSPLPYLKIKDDDHGKVISVKAKFFKPNEDKKIIPPVFMIMGWYGASDGKQDKWLNDWGKKGPPAYFIPHENLHPMETIKSEKVDEDWLDAYEAAKF
jgi:hypothetical protein